MKKIYVALLCSTMLFGITVANSAEPMSKDHMTKDGMAKDHMTKDGMSQ